MIYNRALMIHPKCICLSPDDKDTELKLNRGMPELVIVQDATCNNISVRRADAGCSAKRRQSKEVDANYACVCMCARM